MSRYKKWITYLLLSGLSLCCLGCSTVKRTMTTTERKVFVDTVLHIQFDKIPLIAKVSISDTAILENKTSIAKSYYSVAQQKIILTLSGKTVDVPVKISETTKTITKVKEVTPVRKHLPLRYWIFGIFILLFIYAYLTQKKK